MQQEGAAAALYTSRSEKNKHFYSQVKIRHVIQALPQLLSGKASHRKMRTQRKTWRGLELVNRNLNSLFIQQVVDVTHYGFTESLPCYARVQGQIKTTITLSHTVIVIPE